jgi:DNA helicase-2/ATP-dependent DNA helicase PcrA
MADFVKLTGAQKCIVEAPMGAALVIAGAGSGKTRVLTQRIAYLANSGFSADSVLALTFTNKAAREMKERVDKVLGFSYGVFAGTFHSFCARFLYKNIDKIGYTRDFSIYDTNDTRKAIKEVLTSNPFVELKKDDVKTVEWYVSKIKNENGRAEDFCSGEMLRAVEGYNELLKKNNALDFDDLLVKTLEVFDKCPDVLLAMQNRFRYILVDEFQDTNKVQYDIVQRLAGVHKNIMVVGDEDQCIYTWRGASIDNFKRFQRDFKVSIYKLEENFRSCQNIVKLAGELVENNTDHITKNLFSNLPDGEIGFASFNSEWDEVRFVVSSIIKKVAYGKGNLCDFAIMVRTNALSRLFEAEFRKENIDYTVWGGFKFYDRAEIKVVLNYLRVLLNPRDNVALLDVLNFPKRSVGESSIEKIKEIAAEGCCFDVVRDIEKYSDNFSKKTLAGIKNFRDVISRLATIHDEFGFLVLADHLISEIGLDKAYETSKDLQDHERLENIYQLTLDIKESIKQYPNLDLSMYLKSATLATDTDAPEIKNRVVITTVHSAKGLEFNNVFVVGLEDGLFPISRALSSIEDLEEERRLLYVAITRARRSLHLSHSRTRQMWGKKDDSGLRENYTRPSRFLREMGFEPQNIFERHSSVQPTNFASTQQRTVAKPDTAESLGFKVGDRVSHEKFGNGVIVQIIDVNTLHIKFDDGVQKMLSLAYAKVAKLNT